MHACVTCCTLGIVHLTTALNLLWGLLAGIAFSVYARNEAGHGSRSRRGAWRRFSAVAIIVLALFPCISASDDILGFAALTPSGQQNSSVEDRVSLQLASLLQSLEQIQIAEVFSLVLALSFFGLVTLSWYELRVCRLPALPGRAPPVVWIPHDMARCLKAAAR